MISRNFTQDETLTRETDSLQGFVHLQQNFASLVARPCIAALLGVRDGCDWLGLSGAAANYLVQGGVYCLYASAALALLSLYIYMAGVIKYMN